MVSGRLLTLGAILDIVEFRHIVEFAILSALIGPEGCWGVSDWL